MGIKLNEIMRISPFSEAKLIGGRSGIDREVESANIQEVPDVVRWLKGGEILFSSGYAFQSISQGCKMMDDLLDKKVAALAIKPGQYLQEIPREMIDHADKIGLPLFELPENLPYMDCIIPIFERITEEQLFIMQRVKDIYEFLMQRIMNNEGLVGICDVINRVIGHPVFITSPTGSILASNTWQVDDSQYNDHIQEFLENYCCQNAVTKMRRNQCNVLKSLDRNALICVPVFVHDEHIAYLILDLLDTKMFDMDLIAFEHASTLIAIELLKERALIQKELKSHEQLLEDLLMKRYSDENIMIQRGKHLGFDLTKQYCIFVLDACAFERFLNSMHDISESDVQVIKSRIQESVYQAMQQYPRQFLLMNSSVGVTGLISVRNAEDVLLFRNILDDVVTHLISLYPRLAISAGIGRVKQGVSCANEGWKEAKLALKAGRTLKIDDRFTTNFDELGCLCFLSELKASEAMRDYYIDHLGKLTEYDEKNNAELVKTLETYFSNNGNLRKTAEAMFIHKNSVIYRLKKIESLTGQKLDDDYAAFDLRLCLKIKNIL